MSTASKKAIEQYIEFYGRVFSKKPELVKDIKVEPTDVFLNSMPKSGTTWMQQIIHQLRTGGDEDFKEISKLIPHLLKSNPLLYDATADWHKFTPRAIKLHERYAEAKFFYPNRFIVIFRDPADASWSRYLFAKSQCQLDDMEFADFYELFTTNERMLDSFTFMQSWWERRNDENVLLMFYEHMKADLPFAVRKVAAFLDIPLDRDNKLLNTVVARSSYDYMLKHKEKFDDTGSDVVFVRKMMELTPEKIDSPHVGKVRAGGGQVGQAKQKLDAAALAMIQKDWEQKMMPLTGCESYAKLLDFENATILADL